jgi:hypothetical protein
MERKCTMIMATSASLKYSGETPGNMGDKDKLRHNFIIG